jgi:HAD superfamily hydrolase (TIGR01490 family)
MALSIERSASSEREASCAGSDVMTQKEQKEPQEIHDVTEENRGIAAFFDLDGTLMPLPSMEKRFFSMLRYRRIIGIGNYFLWLAGAVRLVPRGINQIMHANKMYLRGVRVDVEGGGTDTPVCPCVRDQAGKNAERRRGKKGETRRLARMPVPLYPEAVARVAWHAERGHLLVIVSGTLEMLAGRAACLLEAELLAYGLTSKIRLCATRLEGKNERWTGHIVGEAMFGEAKARAVRQIAAEADLDLQRCFAYGDSSSDKWMLEAVGKPAAVNPSNDLGRIARRNHWAVLLWGEEKDFTKRMRKAKRWQRAEEAGERLAAEHGKSGYRA